MNFRAAPDYPCLVSGSFHPPLRVLFSVPSPYSSAIGLQEYLGLDVNATQIPAPNPRNGTQDTWNLPSRLPLRGFHPLWRRIPADFESASEGVPRSYNSTSPLTLRQGVRFALCRVRSPLLPASLLVSFPAPTKMLQFGAFPFRQKPECPRRAGFPIQGSRVQRLHAPTPGLSQLATPFFGTGAKPSTKQGEQA